MHDNQNLSPAIGEDLILHELAACNGTRPIESRARTIESSGDSISALFAYYAEAQSSMDTGDIVSAFFAAVGVRRCAFNAGRLPYRETMLLGGLLKTSTEQIETCSRVIEAHPELEAGVLSRLEEYEAPQAITLHLGRDVFEVHEVCLPRTGQERFVPEVLQDVRLERIMPNPVDVSTVNTVTQDDKSLAYAGS